MHTWKQLIAHGQHAIHMQPCSIITIHETLWSAQCGSGRKPRLGVIADASRLEPPYTTNESLNKRLARANNIGPKQCWIVLRVLIRQVCRVRLLRAGSESSHSTRTRSLLDPAWPIVDTPLRGRLKRSRTQSHTMPHAATDPHQFTSSRTNKPCRTKAHQYHSYMRHTPSRARHRPTRFICARAPTAHPAPNPFTPPHSSPRAARTRAAHTCAHATSMAPAPHHIFNARETMGMRAAHCVLAPDHTWQTDGWPLQQARGQIF